MKGANKHTHRGHCQACGALQAIQNKDTLMAKHGYKVAGFGFFNGTCCGSGHKPLEFERLITDAIIKALLEAADRHDKELAGLQAGKIHPKECPTGRLLPKPGHIGRSIEEMIPWEVANERQRSDAKKLAEWECERQARFNRNHAAMMKELIGRVYGQQPMPMIHEKVLVVAPGLKFRCGPDKKEYEVVRLAHTGLRHVARYAVCKPTAPATMDAADKTITMSLVMIRKYAKEDICQK